ncbi:uncharacterized protein N7443_003402 [Penicillium atrosanguineum]|uniref:Uncharacterized protein n=1 Tax=Penicillium atrosanguineum TaxID=1132637 RepID=A0A9W9PZL2_9EURO|nr:uncharacterized protein N7443_003402 [Penicillium atrosanguineum]KAJ5310941.1 hypothetical protein N7443_003402 [Penicillium atrosanguineum]KAJ5316468.1 hypothetical protein N7476_006775 [Penicillium atrosanguineum]
MVCGLVWFSRFQTATIAVWFLGARFAPNCGFWRTLLQSLPLGTKLSLALNCWTSPFQQAFMAIIAYFLDQDWAYREVLLSFEPLSGTHSGTNLGEVIYKIIDRVLAVTTDNTLNNTTLIAAVNRLPQNPTWVEGLDPKPNPGWVRVELL